MDLLDESPVMKFNTVLNTSGMELVEKVLLRKDKKTNSEAYHE
jgi:hypothetical protein